MGFRTELNVVGCKPPVPVPEFIKVHGYVSKRSEKGQEYLSRLFSQAHFLLLPTRAECSSIVLAEAGSFGVPSITTSVGGLSTVIKNNVNGKLFPLGADVNEYCRYIKGTLGQRAMYHKLALGSFYEYEHRLNWDVAGRAVMDMIWQLRGPAIQ
jgi:glycosyltransferase involved in cell wall biosynthesis